MSSTRTSTHRNARRKRRPFGDPRKPAKRRDLTRYAAGAIVIGVLACLAFFALGGQQAIESASAPAWTRNDFHNSPVLGDTDADGTISGSEKTSLATTEASVKTIRSLIAPQQGVDSMIVTPAGTKWWKFLLDQAYTVGISPAAMPSPGDGVDWYAFTDGTAPAQDKRAAKPGTRTGTTVGYSHFEALHLVFKTPAAALAWAYRNSGRGNLDSGGISYRGRVVTLAPAWLKNTSSLFKPVDELAASAALGHLQVTEGMWSIDWKQRIATGAREAADPDAYGKFWSNLGFGDGAGGNLTWTATTMDPDLPWVGYLDGFNASAVKVTGAIGAINLSKGIQDAINEIYLADKSTVGAGEPGLRPSGGAEAAACPNVTGSDSLLCGSFSSGFRGVVMGTNGRNQGTVVKTDMWVRPTGTRYVLALDVLRQGVNTTMRAGSYGTTN